MGGPRSRARRRREAVRLRVPAALALVLASGLVLAPGCVTFYGSGEVPVRVLVTRDVGTQVLADENVTLPEGASAMDALREVADVSTRYGGGFVQAIDGLESRYPDRKLDWFYHVDTRLADVGAAQHTLEPGQLVVFDYRPWNRSMALGHVLAGLDAWPVDLDDPTFSREAFADRQAEGEQAARLYARVHGANLTLLDARGEPARTLPAPWLLAHAVDGPGEDPRILLVASGPEGRDLSDDLAATRPVGVGRALTPNASHEVPAG